MKGNIIKLKEYIQNLPGELIDPGQTVYDLSEMILSLPDESEPPASSKEETVNENGDTESDLRNMMFRSMHIIAVDRWQGKITSEDCNLKMNNVLNEYLAATTPSKRVEEAGKEMYNTLKWLGDIMLNANDGGAIWCAMRDRSGAKEFFMSLKSILSKPVPSLPISSDAVEFAELLEKSYVRVVGGAHKGKWFIKSADEDADDLYYTTPELYNLFINSKTK